MLHKFFFQPLHAKIPENGQSRRAHLIDSSSYDGQLQPFGDVCHNSARDRYRETLHRRDRSPFFGYHGTENGVGQAIRKLFFFRRRSGRFTFRFHFVATFSFLCSHLFASSAMATGGEPSPPWTDEQMHKDDVSKKDLVTFLQENGAKKVRLFPSFLSFFSFFFFFFFFFFAEKHVATLIVHMYKQLIVAMFLLGSFWKNTRFSEKLQALPRDRRRTTWSQLIINFSKPRWAHRFLFIVYFSTSSFFLLPVSFPLFLILPFFPSSFSFPAFLFFFFVFFFFVFVCLPDCLCQEVTFHVAVGGSVFH